MIATYDSKGKMIGQILKVKRRKDASYRQGVYFATKSISSHILGGIAFGSVAKAGRRRPGAPRADW